MTRPEDYGEEAEFIMWWAQKTIAEAIVIRGAKLGTPYDDPKFQEFAGAEVDYRSDEIMLATLKQCGFNKLQTFPFAENVFKWCFNHMMMEEQLVIEKTTATSDVAGVPSMSPEEAKAEQDNLMSWAEQTVIYAMDCRTVELAAPQDDPKLQVDGSEEAEFRADQIMADTIAQCSPEMSKRQRINAFAENVFNWCFEHMNLGSDEDTAATSTAGILRET